MKLTTKVAFALIISLAAVLPTIAQNRQASSLAYNEWRGRVLKSLNGNNTFNYYGIGVAVQKVGDEEMNVNFSVGTSLGVREVKPLIFTVQPISVPIDGNESLIKNIGAPSRLRSSEIDRAVEETEEIVLNPQMIVPIMNEVNAVRVSISGFESDLEKEYTIVLPISSEVKTAALGKIMFDEQTRLTQTKCSWFIGYCQTGCPVLCVGCNDNSPVLNCARCIMSCANGQTCTPSTPRPADCPG